MVPEEFAFSVKVPQSITHEKKMKDVTDELQIFTDIIMQ